MARFLALFGLILVLSHADVAFARSAGSSASSVHVHGYTRKDGTRVGPYQRRLPGTATHGARGTSVSNVGGGYNYRAHVFTGYVGARDANGRIVRSEAAKDEFMRMTGFPHGRPGYVVDHIIALKRGGPDVPSNMQWQTVAEAKAKDRWE